MCAPHRLPPAESIEISLHGCGIGVALARVVVTGFEEDFVEFEQAGVVGLSLQIRRQLREVLAVFSDGNFVEDFAQAVDVRLRGAGAFRWNVAHGADEGARFVNRRHESDVRQLRFAVHEDDVRRFDVAVHQALRVQVFQRHGQFRADGKAFRQWQMAASAQVIAQGARSV